MREEKGPAADSRLPEDRLTVKTGIMAEGGGGVEGLNDDPPAAEPAIGNEYIAHAPRVSPVCRR